MVNMKKYGVYGTDYRDEYQHVLQRMPDGHPDCYSVVKFCDIENENPPENCRWVRGYLVMPSDAKYSGAKGTGSTSLKGARSKRDFSAQGTVQSKTVLQVIPWPRIEGL